MLSWPVYKQGHQVQYYHMVSVQEFTAQNSEVLTQPVVTVEL